MRSWGLVVVLCASVGCYVGPGDVTSDATDDGSSSSDSGPPPPTSAPTGPSGPPPPGDSSGDPGGSSGDPGDSTGDPGGSSDGPGDSSDSGNQMTGCEQGPLPDPIPGCAPAPLPSSGDIHQDCVDRINQLRWECQCLPPLARWSEAEACSDSQSSADQNGGGPHGNFGMCGENAQNTCPNWGSEQQVIGGCLQSMWDEGPGEPFSEHGHYINMSSPNYSRVACGFASGNGGVWSNQNFSP